MDADSEQRDIERLSDLDLAALVTSYEANPSLLFCEFVVGCLRELQRLRAQPSPREVALPLEPTAEMLSAGGAVYDHPSVYMGGPSARGRRLAGRAYKAMIEAALSQASEDQP